MMASNFVFDNSFHCHSSPETDLHFFSADPLISSLCDSTTIDVLQEISNNQNPIYASSFDQFSSDILSSSPPSHLLENLSLYQTTQLQPALQNGSNLANGYQNFTNLGAIEVKSEDCQVGFESGGYNQSFVPHSYTGVENATKYMQRSYSSNSFDAKPGFFFQPRFDTLMESPAGSQNQAMSSPENNFLPGHMRRVCSTGDLLNIRTAHATQRSLSSPLATENNSFTEEANFKVGRYSAEERKERISKYRAKRTQRNFNKTIKYACRKTLADNRPRIRGRFARNDETGEIPKVACSTREEDEDELWLEGLHDEEERDETTRGAFTGSSFGHHHQAQFQYYGF